MSWPKTSAYGFGSIFVMLAAGYALFTGFVYVSQDRLLYLPNLPSRRLVATPQAVHLVFDEIFLSTADHETLHGWWLPPPAGAADRGTVLFFHGNAGNISHRLESLRIFHDLGLGVFIFDYRGYGRSTGKPSEEGTYRDAEAAWRYLTEERRLPAGEIIFFGRSLGGAVAAWLAARTQPAGLILESSFTSVPELAAGLYPWLPARLLCKFRYHTAAQLASVSSPLLVVHSPDDEIIPFAHGQKLFEAAAGEKTLLEIHGSHNEGFYESGPLYRQGLSRFVDQVLPRTVGGEP